MTKLQLPAKPQSHAQLKNKQQKKVIKMEENRTEEHKSKLVMES